jgi:hypothetical protein
LIPDEIETIGRHCFQECESVVSIRFGPATRV